MNLIKKLKIHFWRMKMVWRIHGLKAALGLYVAKTPILNSILKRIFGRILIRTKVLGSVMYLNIFDEGLHRKLLLKGIREISHVNQIRNNVKEGMIGIELGANVGYFALLGARLVGPSGKIYCIEPELRNLSLLKKNVAANGFEDRMKVFRYIVGDHNGMDKLFLSEYGNTHTMSPLRGKHGAVETPMITIDTFLEQNQIKPGDVDFIRMDIEGYEVIAFKGMEKLFAANPKLKIFMEFHPSYYPEWGWNYEKLLRYLEGHGFKVREVAQDRELDEQGNICPVILKNPTVEEILEMERKTAGDGGQAFLEKVTS